MAFLNNNKTYLGMILSGFLGIAWSQGWIDDQWAATLGSIIAAWTGIAVAHKAQKLTDAVKNGK